MSNWKPIFFSITQGKQISIGSPEEALVFMDANPVIGKGELFRRARKHCLACAEDPSAIPKAELAVRAAVNMIGVFPDARRRPAREASDL